MAVHSRKDFAKLCGIESKDLSNYVKRGKVILTPDKKVDDDVPENAEFIESRKNKSDHISIEIKEKKLTPDQLKMKQKNLARIDLNHQLKELEKEELEEKIEVLRMKKQSMAGILIPVDLVKTLVEQNFRSFTISFQQGADNLILEISKKKKLSREEAAKVRKKLTDIINNSVEDGISNTERGLEDIVKAFTKKRGVGERK